MSIGKSAFWIVVERIGEQGIQFVVAIILARLLAPSEFGLIAMVTIFTSLGSRLAFGGFSGALIQRPKVTDTDISTVFWYNLSLGIFLTVVLTFAAPAISHFYNEPRLILLTRVSALTILLSSLEMTHSAIIIKELRYKKRSIITIFSIILSGGASIIMAYQGYGVWALVAQGLIMHLVLVVCYWSFSDWKLRFAFDVGAFKEMFAFGHNLMLTVLVRTVFENIYSVIIGKTNSATQLGYFYRGKRFTLLASQIPALMLSQLSFPAMSKCQNDKQKMLETFSLIFRKGMVIIIPLLTGMIVVAPNLITVLVGEKWLPSVPYLRILCVTGFFYVMFFLCGDVLRASGEGRLFLKCELIKNGLVLVTIFILLRYGILMLLAGEVLATALGFLVSSTYAMRCINGRVRSFVIWLYKPIVAAGCMALSIYLLKVQNYTLSTLLLQVATGAMVYLTSLIILKEDAAPLKFF